MPPRQSKRRPNSSTQRPSGDHTPLATTLIRASEREHEDGESFDDNHTEIPMHLSVSRSSIPQASQPSLEPSSGLASYSKRRRAKTSSIREYVTQQGNALVCNVCSKTYQLSTGTGAISRHLKEKHSIDSTFTSVAEKRRKEGTAIDVAILREAEFNFKAEEERRKGVMRVDLDRTTLEYLYLQWTIPMNIPLKQVRDHGFRTFLEYINPIANRMLPDSDMTVKVHAEGLFAEGKQRLRYVLATALSDIHITCNMWTSPNEVRLLAVVGHFTSEKLKLQSVTLGLVELQGDCGGENQAAVVLSVLDDYEIRKKLGYLVVDGAHANDTLVRTIADAMRDQGVLYDAKQQRLWCNRQVINLTVQAFLFGEKVNDYEYLENLGVSPSDTMLNQWRKLGPLGKLHNIVVWIMGSPQRIQSFKVRSGGLMPRCDNSTKRNSWYEMLHQAVSKLKGSIIAVTNEEPELQKDLLTGEEWKTLGHICDFLRNFHDVMEAIEGHQATLEHFLPAMDFLAFTFKNAIEQFKDHTFLRESLQTGFTKLLEYSSKTERSPVHIAAVVLDPTTKWAYFKNCDPEWQPNMEAKLKMFWETKYRSSTGLPSYLSTASTPAMRKSTNSEYLDWMERRLGLRAEQHMRDELGQYAADPMLLADALEGGTILQWWLSPKQRTRYPLLSKMAIDIYSIPAMSSEAEHVFSGPEHTVSDQRAGLKSETIELLECLKSWFRLGIFTEKDLHAIVGTMTEGAAEALEDLDEALG